MEETNKPGFNFRDEAEALDYLTRHYENLRPEEQPDIAVKYLREKDVLLVSRSIVPDEEYLLGQQETLQIDNRIFNESGYETFEKFTHSGNRAKYMAAGGIESELNKFEYRYTKSLEK